MATAKKTTTKKATKKAGPKFLSKSEYDKFFSYIGKARVMAKKIADDKDRPGELKRAMNSIEKKLWNIGNDYRWGALTGYNSKI